jgi:(p)ppGpp synthase/HD superfamily hydrolase
MIYSPKLREAIEFAIQVHHTDDRQTRKGKDIPYITHPITVAMILARAGASEDVIISGILHDTIEDSSPMHKVTRAMIADRFGEYVAILVDSVTEHNKALPWSDRKKAALKHIESFTNDSVLVKSGDVLSNVTEILSDQTREGDAIWARFNSSKDAILQNYLGVMTALITKWPESPLAEDLQRAARELQFANAPSIMLKQ